MNQKIFQKTVGDVKRILIKNKLSTKVGSINIEELLRNRIEQQENNLLVFCKDAKDYDYILKYSITHLTGKKHSGVRALLNVKNEINFYQQVVDEKNNNVIIPKLLDASSRPHPYLILEKLDVKEIELFPEDTFFRKNFLPMNIIEPVIKGMIEFQSLKVDKDIFHHMTTQNIQPWLSLIEGAYRGKIKHIKQRVRSLFSKYSSLWDREVKSLVHGDIEGDTFGYEKGTNRIVLLDFEKTQIGHPLHDFAFFVQNPQERSWNKAFVKTLLIYFPQKEYHILFTLSRLLKTLTCLNNFRTGRIDHVFVGILGNKKRYEEMKKIYIPLWEKDALELVETV